MSLMSLLTNDHLSRVHSCQQTPETKLVAAILLRGTADYILYLMRTKHFEVTKGVNLSELKTSLRWLREKEEDFSAYNCCEILNLPWKTYLAYLKQIRMISENLDALQKEYVKFR